MLNVADAWAALPANYRDAARATLLQAHRQQPDRWPDLPMIVAFGKQHHVDVERLAAIFGFVTLPYRLKNAIAFRDTMRGADVPPDHIYDARLRPFYEFFRAAMADDVPIYKRRPLYADAPTI